MVQILCFSWLPMLSLLEEIHQAREVNRYVAPTGFKASFLLGDHPFIEEKNLLNVWAKWLVYATVDKCIRQMQNVEGEKNMSLF